MNLCIRAVCENVVPYSVLKKYAERCADNVELDRQTRSIVWISKIKKAGKSKKLTCLLSLYSVIIRNQECP